MGKYISQITTELTIAPATDDLLHIQDISDTTNTIYGTSKKITVANLLEAIPSETVFGLSALGAAPAIGDILEILDISDTTDTVNGTSKKMTVAELQNAMAPRCVQFTIGDGTNAITAGIVAITQVPYAGTITKSTLVSIDAAGAAVSGSVVIDLWKDTYANFAPTVADTITAAAKPTLSTETKSQDATLTGWTTAIAAGDYIIAVVDSATTVKQVIVTLEVLV